jgi:O-antigen/teichoic acid export membrane protein
MKNTNNTMSSRILRLQRHLAAGIGKLRGGKSLKLQAARGSVWLGAAGGIEQGLRLARNMILTRLLAPEAFGMMAIVLAINAAFESFTEIGIKHTIVQNPKGEQRTFLNGAWWLAFVRGLGLYALAFVAAPWMASFYENPELVPFMRAAFLVIVFNGALSVRAYVAIKEMKFKQWVMIHHGGGVVGILTAVLLVFVMRNVWALVIGFLVEAAARCLLSFLICPYRPGFNFDKEAWKALVKYARGMVGLPILTFIFMRADIFVIGKLCSPAQLGLYSVVVALAQMPLQLLSVLMSQVIMPAFSKIQTDAGRLNQVLLGITSVMALLGFPLLLFALFYGQKLLLVVYGAPYAQVTGPFSAAFATSLVRFFGVPIATVCFSTGRPELHRFFTALRVVLIVSLIYPAVKFLGLTGAAVAVLMAIFVSHLLQVMRLRKITGLDLSQYSMIFLPAAGISICVAIVWLATQNFTTSAPLLHLFTGAIGCLAAYALVLMISLRSETRLAVFIRPILGKQP